MKLAGMMVKDVIQAAPDETIGVAGKRMRERAVGCLVVTVAGAVKGIVTDRDLLACLAAAHDPYRCKISTHMRRPVHVLRPDEDHTIAGRSDAGAAHQALADRAQRQAFGHRLAIGSRRDCRWGGGRASDCGKIFYRRRAHSGVPERTDQRSQPDGPRRIAAS